MERREIPGSTAAVRPAFRFGSCGVWRSGWFIAAFVWGLAEATFFFIVPDVLLSFVTQRRGFRAGLGATVFAVAGAAGGGMAMLWLGRDHPEQVRAALDALPAISPKMIATAGPALAADPLAALVGAAFSGTPFKVFAAAASGAGVSAPALFAMTVVARAPRFLVTVAVTATVDRLAANWLGTCTRGLILGALWAVFYAVYWSVMPG
jgi:membrane protein YqaA with SNARE-associated domain